VCVLEYGREREEEKEGRYRLSVLYCGREREEDI
jgi:hypothetical protein